MPKSITGDLTGYGMKSVLGSDRTLIVFLDIKVYYWYNMFNIFNFIYFILNCNFVHTVDKVFVIHLLASLINVCGDW